MSEQCCEHGLNWHHETRGCGYHGFGADRCPCPLRFDEALAVHDAEVYARALRDAVVVAERIAPPVNRVQALESYLRRLMNAHRTPKQIAGDILASDWLAAHDAEVRREVAERIAQEIGREHPVGVSSDYEQGASHAITKAARIAGDEAAR